MIAGPVPPPGTDNSTMPTLSELIEDHLRRNDLSVRALAQRAGMSYPTLLSVMHKGGVPRKTEHREALRETLGVAHEQWAAVLAATGANGIDLPSDGPLTLQQ